MKVCDIQRGKVSTIEVKPSNGVHFEFDVPDKAEITLHQSGYMGEMLLRQGEHGCAVKGSDSRNQTLLTNTVHRDLPKLCWVAGKIPQNGHIQTLILQIHEFPSRHIWPDAIDMGIDEKVVEHIRKKRGQLTSVESVVEWLTKKIIIPPNNSEMDRVLLSGSPKPRLSRSDDPDEQDDDEIIFPFDQSAFRLYGKGIAADVVHEKEDKFKVSRIVRAFQNDEKRLVLLIEGKFQFCDMIIAGAFRGVARTELDQIVKEADSYLGIWKEYNRLERENILARCRKFGWLKYTAYKRLADSRFRFTLEDADGLNEPLQYLEENETVALETSEFPPPELRGILRGDDPDGRLKRRSRSFFGECTDFNPHQKTIDIRPMFEENAEHPPEKGVIFVSWSGDRVRLDRRDHAQVMIASADCPMPQLGLLVEGKLVRERRRRTGEPLSAEARKMFGGEPTARQIQAIDIALNTPDIALIQGPPGTGKTRVIAALTVRLAQTAKTAEGISGQYLLTSFQHDAVENVASQTQVFGLPAIKVGKKWGQADDGDHAFERWRREKADKVRNDLDRLPERPLSDILREIHRRAAAYVISAGPYDDPAKLLQEISELSGKYLPPKLKDRIIELRLELKQSRIKRFEDAEMDRELVIKTVRCLRTQAVSFSDDGPYNALKTLRRLQRLNILQADEEDLLKRASYSDIKTPADFLDDLKNLKGTLLDRLIPDQRPAGSPIVHEGVQALLSEIIDSLYRQLRESQAGTDAVLYDYWDDLENDAEGVRRTVQAYTAVLAATCHHAIGGKMREMKDDKTVFESVIADEAARANPLDLFIPMSRAERRIILVGDHRQLPHILEADVERQLEQSGKQSQDILKKSLFYRLFKSLKELEAKDGIKRTITLDAQYRMHPVLGKFVSETFYEPYGERFDSPRPASDFVHGLDPYQDKVAVWKNISGQREAGRQSKHRITEAQWIAKEAKRLMELRPDFSFGIITFYAAQVRIIFEELERTGIAGQSDSGGYRILDQWKETEETHKERLLVGTVDAFQGKEFDVSFLSMVRSNGFPCTDEKSWRRKYGYLIHENRLCVALSRQRRLIILAGDMNMLRNDFAENAIPGLVKFRKLCEGEYGLCI